MIEYGIYRYGILIDRWFFVRRLAERAIQDGFYGSSQGLEIRVINGGSAYV